MNKIKAVIFDMDGVLIDAKEWHYDSFNKALNYFGFNISRTDHIATYDGLPTKKKLEMLTQYDDLPSYLHAFLNELKQKFTMQIINERCSPTFEHKFALSKLKRDGYKLALASNSVKNSIESMMYKAQLDEYLDFKLSNQDVKHGKPDPEIYLLAIKKLGLSPSECLIVEDNPHGIEAAFASGAHVLEVPDTNYVNYKNIKTKIKEIEKL